MKSIKNNFDIKKCFGCRACVNICPKNAITMETDEFGFTYPKIDDKKCIDCGLCSKVCIIDKAINEVKNLSAFVALAKDDKLLVNSASGGAFATIANNILKQNGAVYGCSMEKDENGVIEPRHIRVSNCLELEKLQGSKYVQSNMGLIYKYVKEDLEKELKVLFSGTPCQVSGLKKYLGAKEYSNLYTLDIICHGVPSTKMFQDYIKFLEKKLKITITDFKFRDKTKGWGLFAKVMYKKNGKEKSKILSSIESSYYQLFLDSLNYRENCYKCPFAGKDRVGDITIGDYWGIEKEHPEYINNEFNSKKGISCLIVNNEQGKKLLDKYCEGLNLKPSTFSKIAIHNKQLNSPSKKLDCREEILQLYAKYGYEKVDEWYKHHRSKLYIIKKIWYKLPYSVRKMIKK